MRIPIRGGIDVLIWVDDHEIGALAWCDLASVAQSQKVGGPGTHSADCLWHSNEPLAQRKSAQHPWRGPIETGMRV